MHHNGIDPSREDDAIVMAARDDIDAFAPLYQRYSGPIYRWMYRETGDVDVANDLAAQVFAQALQNLRRYQPQQTSSFRSWLFTIARNLLRDSWRRYRPTSLPLHLVDHRPGPEELAIHRTEMDELRVARAHRAIPGAYEPAADVWQRAKSYAVPVQTREGKDMEMNLSSTLSNPATPVRMIVHPSRKVVNQFTTAIATLAIVAIIAFGGWFAATNLQPGEEIDPPFAALGVNQATAGNAVCDVEPLTVDQAVRIVQDPVAYMYSGTEEAPPENLDPNWVGAPLKDWGTLMSLASYTAIPVTDDEFFALTAFAEEYGDCLVAGTKGQLWAMTDPIVVQYEIATRIPLLQPMDATEVVIADLLARPNKPSDASSALTWRANPDRKLTQRVDMGLTFSSGSSYVIPFQILKASGEVGASHDIFGNLIAEGDVSEAAPGNIVVIRSRADQTWYIVGGFEPSALVDAPAT